MAGSVTGLAASGPPGQDRQKTGVSGRNAATARAAAAPESMPAFRPITAERPENGGNVPKNKQIGARLRALVDEAQSQDGVTAGLEDGVPAEKRAPPVSSFDAAGGAASGGAITDRLTLVRGIAAYREALDLARAAPFTTARGG